MAAGISLANKCQLLFGFSVVVILAAALSVPWISTRRLVAEFQIEEARRIADAWLDDRIELGALHLPGTLPASFDEMSGESGENPLLRMTFIKVGRIDPADEEYPFVVEAIRRFRTDGAVTEHVTLTTGLGQGFADDNNASGSFGFAQGSLGTALAFGLSVPLGGAWDLNGSASYEYDISENEQIIAFDFSVSFGF